MWDSNSQWEDMDDKKKHNQAVGRLQDSESLKKLAADT